MATLANALKEEISRIVRKEVRQQTAETARSTAKGERDIAELKRQIQALQQKPSATRTQDASRQPAGKKAPSKKAAAKGQDGKAAGAQSAKQSARARFSAEGLKKSRERLGLSADNYGRLIGVSGLSIYNWEQGKARPRESSIAALTTIKGIGKREAAKRLEALAKKEKESEKGAAKEKPAAREKPAAGGDQDKS